MARDSAERVRQLLASLVTGYTMSLQRIERALRQHGLEAIPTAWASRSIPSHGSAWRWSPTAAGRRARCVEEVRRGYLWNGRVFRYAQVRVARS